MAQVKNEEEKKKENVKKVSKKTTETKKTTTKKTTSRTSDNEATKKQTTAKKTTTAAKKTATGKKTKSEALKNEELNNINKELKNASNLENIKVKKTGTKTAGAKVSGEKLSEKTTRNSKTKTAKSPKTNKSKGKVTKVSGSKKMGEVVEEGDAVITDAIETSNVVKVEDEEKMQLMEKDLKSKSKLPKTEEKKLSSVVFENLCVAIAIMVYLVFMILGFMNIKEEVYNVDLKVFSFIILVIAILLFERAYKKDSGKLCAFGIETLFLAIATMGLLYVNIEIQNIFLPIAASISMLFAIYYVAKSIYLYSKMKKKYFVDNMKDIIQKEEKE